jgi:hypothetical protein
MQSSAALLSTASAALTEVPGQGAAMRREATCGIAADNLLTGHDPVCLASADELMRSSTVALSSQM